MRRTCFIVVILVAFAWSVQAQSRTAIPRPHSHHGASASEPPDAELDKYPKKPEAQFGRDWIQQLNLHECKLEKDTTLWNHHRETDTWPWETLVAGTEAYCSADGIPRYKKDCINRLVFLNKPAPLELPSPALVSQAETRQTVGRTNVEVTLPEPPPPPPPSRVEQKVGGTSLTVNVPSPPPPPPPPTVIQEVGDTNININIGGRRRQESKREEPARPKKSSQFFGPSSTVDSFQTQRIGDRTIEIDIEEPENRWGFTFGGTLGRFDSDPVSRVVRKIVSRDVCDVSGWYADLGVSFGRPRASFWRFVLTAKIFDEWSNSKYFCFKCGTEVFVTTRDMKVWGLGVERVQLFGPDRWPVRPTVTGRLGVGVVTGRAERFVWSEVTQLTTFERVGAGELFGSRYLLDVGFAPAVTVLLGKHVLVMEGPGITWPGLHYAKASLTLRP